MATRFVEEQTKAEAAFRKPPPDNRTVEERLQAFREANEYFAQNHRDLPQLPDEAFERESFYDDSYRAGLTS